MFPSLAQPHASLLHHIANIVAAFAAGSGAVAGTGAAESVKPRDLAYSLELCCVRRAAHVPSTQSEVLLDPEKCTHVFKCLVYV